ncbi:MAG: hypothetical protein J6C50_00430 [Rickettsiales bacterium]|nr:hypothetical protein [Rickettsiales bacterium]
MLLDNIKKQNSKVFIFGINKTSVALINYLSLNEINVVVSDISENIVKEYELGVCDNTFIDVVNIEKIDFNSVDYFVLCENILLEKDELGVFLTRLNNIKDKVYIDIEFISNLFPQNKYIGIIGSSYNITINSLINNMFSNAGVKNIECSSGYEDADDGTTVFDDVMCSEAIQNHKIQYLKQMEFDILAILGIDVDLKKDKKYIDNIKNYILTNQSKDSILILNADDDVLKNMYDDIVTNVEYKIIPISVNKMLNNGISYINGTIYNYFEDNNESYDVTTNDGCGGDINNVSLLCSSIIAKFCGVDVNTIIESVKNFNGVVNHLECVEEIENIRFVNNIGANTEKLFYEPFNVYDNIYVIFIANDKQNDLSCVKNCLKKTENIFIVDVCGLLNIDDISDKVDLIKYNNLQDAFNSIITEIDFEDKETNTTVLLSPIVGDEMNCIYYKDYIKEYKELIKGLNKC